MSRRLYHCFDCTTGCGRVAILGPRCRCRRLEADRPTTYPDIYLLVLDKYTGNEVLKEHFGFDNASFEEFLRSRGFVVPRSSQANYPQTPLALASMLNLDYLQDLPPELNLLRSDRAQPPCRVSEAGRLSFRVLPDWVPGHVPESQCRPATADAEGGEGRVRRGLAEHDRSTGAAEQRVCGEWVRRPVAFS